MARTPRSGPFAFPGRPAPAKLPHPRRGCPEISATARPSDWLSPSGERYPMKHVRRGGPRAVSSPVFEPITRFAQRAAVPIVVLLGFCVGVAALFFTGAANPTLLNDPGTVVRFGLPAAKLLFNIALSLTVGALMFAVLILPPTAGGRGPLHRTVAEVA